MVPGNYGCITILETLTHKVENDLFPHPSRLTTQLTRQNLFLDETYPTKLVGWGYHRENFMILISTAFDSSTHATERQTDRRTDGR